MKPEFQDGRIPKTVKSLQLEEKGPKEICYYFSVIDNPHNKTRAHWQRRTHGLQYSLTPPLFWTYFFLGGGGGD